MRNIAKFSPKWPKKQSFFDFFDFFTNCSYDSNESESEGKRLKPTPLPHMRLWFFVRPQCMRSGHFFYRTTKLLDRQAETHQVSAKGSPFVYSILNVRWKTGQDYRVPPLNFFRHCATFEIFCRQRFPLPVFAHDEVNVHCSPAKKVFFPQ